MMTEFARNGKQATVVLPSNFAETSSMFEQMLAANIAKDETEPANPANTVQV